MGVRILAFAILLVFASHAAHAADPDKERLKQLLEQKFGKKVPSNSKTRSATEPNDIYVIQPDGSVKRAPSNTVKRRPRSELGAAIVAEFGAVEQWKHRQVRGVRIAQSGGGAAGYVHPASSVLVRRGTIVVQLKPSATSAQIDALIAKYNLNVVKYSASLGVLYVALPGDDGGSASGRSMKSVLEPKLVLDLRREPAVSAAFVDVSLSPRSRLRNREQIRASVGERAIRWNWATETKDDGNWGMKAMRMPVVWTALDRLRNVEPKPAKPVMAFLDNGFVQHNQLSFRQVKGKLLRTPTLADCGMSHGTHVAGIAGAIALNGDGIFGLVPDAQVDAIQISNELLVEGVSEGTGTPQQHVAFFMDAITDLAEYLDEQEPKPGERRVVNISLGYNWARANLVSQSDATADRIIRDQIRQHAKIVQFLVNRVQEQVLFVVAAGNDSDGLQKPFDAALASPFAFAALHKSPGFEPSTNIIVVEAHDRDGKRASFSNTGGHVSAPGVDIMSILADNGNGVGVCSGTSQAAPHVAALASILFELSPSRKPADMIEIIRSTASQSGDGSLAPRVDAFSALLRLDRGFAKLLADLNGDGKVDEVDLAIFKSDLTEIQNGRFGQKIGRDLNGDGVIDEFERCWPRIDLNGSGRASYDPTDVRNVAGEAMSDLDVLKFAWSDQGKPYEVALADSGLKELMNVWWGTVGVAAVSRITEKQPCE